MRQPQVAHSTHPEALRVGVIGCGYWGPKLIRNFYEMPKAVVTIVADLNPDRLSHIERTYPGVVVTRDYRELLHHDIDAVVIATPIYTHYQLAKEALLQDKHVLVEKPITADSGQAAELIELAASRCKVLMVGHTFEYNPAVVALRDIIARGEIGDVYYIDAKRVNLGIFQKDVNVIWDLAPHDLSILLFVLSLNPTAISARGSAYVQPGIHDVAFLDVSFPKNITAHLHLSWLDPCKIRRITVVGSKKMVVYDDVENLEKIKIYDKGIDLVPYTDNFGDFQLSYRYGEISTPQIPWAEPLKIECQHFLECIATGQSPRSDGKVGWKVVRVLEMAQKSLLNGGLREAIPW